MDKVVIPNPKLGWTELGAKAPRWTETTRMDRVVLLFYTCDLSCALTSVVQVVLHCPPCPSVVCPTQSCTPAPSRPVYSHKPLRLIEPRRTSREGTLRPSTFQPDLCIWVHFGWLGCTSRLDGSGSTLRRVSRF
jgi:hypothetical protein